jgi:hypothetical protein
MTATRVTLGSVVKVLIVCFLVGLVLAFLDVDPRNIFHDLVGLVRRLFELSVDFFGWAVSYVLLGAVVVLPIWAVILLFRFLRGRT